MQTQAHDRSQATQALQERLLSNQRGDFDLSTWICDHLRDIGPGSRVLSLGAGTGEHLLRYAAPVGPQGLCAALDLSQGSLRQLQERALALSRPSLCLQGDMDQLRDPQAWPQLRGLTHVVASYSLYYSQDAGALLDALRARLAPGGCVVVVGPAQGNNAAWYQLLQSARYQLPAWLLDISEHFWEAHLWPQRARWASVTWRQASNHVPFSSPEALLRYWRSNLYHEPAQDALVERAIHAWFSQHPIFWNTKHIALARLEVSHA